MTSQMDFSLSDALGRLASRSNLSREEASRAMTILLGGEATPAQMGAFLMGLRMKGETEAEVAGLVESMRNSGVRIAPGRGPLVDLCGTGGDGLGTFNISTAASFVAAGSGCAVAKHGNRSASSRCGSADVLEALQVPIDLAPERACAMIDDIGFAFLFAPLYHPAMKHVGPVRRELKIRTVFNLLGPLSNPAGAPYQLVGVYDDSVRPLMARVLGLLGARKAWVVHGAGNVDEISVAGPTHVTAAGTVAIQDRSAGEITLRPEECGIDPRPLDSLRGGDAAENARIIERVLGGEAGPHRDAVLLNAGAAVHVAGLASTLREGIERARESIDSGKAHRILDLARRLR